jgi:glycine/D-amino acid oxidase-like deaminating enzyme
MSEKLPPPRSLWEETAVPASDHVPVAGSVRAEIAVVGGGYTGLSAALHLAEAGRDVALIERRAPGWGASGRNGGQVIAGVKHDPEVLLALFGASVGERMVETVGAAPDAVFGLIARHGIGCDAVQAGWIQPAVSAATLGVSRERVRQWRAAGADVSLLDAAEIARLLGSNAYLGGMLDRRGGTVQPLSYARGLAAAAVRAGARIFGGTTATGLERAGSGWRLAVPGGEVVAERVILATNAYADRLHDGLRRSVVAVPSWQVATGKLPASVRDTILPGRQSGSDMRRLLRYFRLDAEGRFVIGARGSYAEPQPGASLKRLCAAAVKLFPQLRGVAFEYQWGGMVALTPDHLPHLHVLAPGLFAGLGYNGRGVAMATVMGRELASLALGTAPEAAGLPVAPLRPVRFHAASRLGVLATVAWYRMLDGTA